MVKWFNSHSLTPHANTSGPLVLYMSHLAITFATMLRQISPELGMFPD